VNVTIEIPEDRAARFQKQAHDQGLSVEEWLLQLAERAAGEHAPVGKNLVDVCAMVRGLADDLDFSRNPSPSRTVDI
jgi:hypothetical protein